MLDRLIGMQAADGEAKGLARSVVGEDGILRVYQRQRGPVFPTIERYFVVAPALAHRKEHANFDQWWAQAVATARASETTATAA